MQLRNKKGFTLVEIMIVVVIIGLLAAMAIPAFNRVRRQSRQTTLVQDGRVLGNSAQQYFLTTGNSQAVWTYDSTTGAVTGDLTPWVTTIGKGYTVSTGAIASGSASGFTLAIGGAFDGAAVTFTDEGKTTVDPTK